MFKEKKDGGSMGAGVLSRRLVLRIAKKSVGKRVVVQTGMLRLFIAAYEVRWDSHISESWGEEGRRVWSD